MHRAAAYNPVRIRNIPQEMANHALERGEGLTRENYRALGYTDDQIDRHAHDASVLYAQQTNRYAA